MKSGRGFLLGDKMDLNLCCNCTYFTTDEKCLLSQEPIWGRNCAAVWMRSNIGDCGPKGVLFEASTTEVKDNEEKLGTKVAPVVIEDFKPI